MRRNLWLAALTGGLVALLATPAIGAERRLDPEVEAGVREALERGPTPRVRLQAAITLGNVGTERSLPALVAALDDPHPGVRGAAALALGNLQQPGTISALLARASDRDPFVVDRVHEALLRFRGTAALRRFALEAAYASAANRAFLVGAIAGFTGEEADAALVSFFADPEPVVREALVRTVAWLPRDRREAVLLAGLASDCDRTRLGAIRASGPIAEAAALEPLLRIAENDAEPAHLRGEARRALRDLRDLVDPMELARVVRQGDDPAARARAVTLAGLRGGKEGSQVVAEALRDPAAAVRLSAGRAVLDLEHDRPEKALRSALVRERDDRVRRTLERVVRSLEAGEPPPWQRTAIAADELPEP